LNLLGLNRVTGVTAPVTLRRCLVPAMLEIDRRIRYFGGSGGLRGHDAVKARFEAAVLALTARPLDQADLDQSVENFDDPGTRLFKPRRQGLLAGPAVSLFVQVCR
jgi:hypothetical protein